MLRIARSNSASTSLKGSRWSSPRGSGADGQTETDWRVFIYESYRIDSLISEKKGFDSNRIIQRFLAGFDRAHSVEHVGQSRRIENLGGSFADILHHEANGTGALIGAFVASHVGGPADAGQRRDGPIDDSDDLTDRDRIGRLGEKVPATLALLTLQQAVVF